MRPIKFNFYDLLFQGHTDAKDDVPLDATYLFSTPRGFSSQGVSPKEFCCQAAGWHCTQCL